MSELYENIPPDRWAAYMKCAAAVVSEAWGALGPDLHWLGCVLVEDVEDFVATWGDAAEMVDEATRILRDDDLTAHFPERVDAAINEINDSVVAIADEVARYIGYSSGLVNNNTGQTFQGGSVGAYIEDMRYLQERRQETERLVGRLAEQGILFSVPGSVRDHPELQSRAARRIRTSEELHGRQLKDYELTRLEYRLLADAAIRAERNGAGAVRLAIARLQARHPGAYAGRVSQLTRGQLQEWFLNNGYSLVWHRVIAEELSS